MLRNGDEEGVEKDDDQKAGFLDGETNLDSIAVSVFVNIG